ncbi:hypothetical protein D9619_004787 [Psilocybe cf. subviscida]|uniref:Uncharacterized protein n=1 Tax=Psilocybe cf. subviscida TaxID=2480587 RepID=A0A8H5F840_9AGAR|nr:hypothetical protein D9619_004787 [Psilocybe cf. subviscida]
MVKARAKDTISRQQKSHFGRQRLDILARGVAALRPSELANAIPGSAFAVYRPTAQDIDLAHAHAQARTKLPVGPSGNEYGKRYIPSPVHVVPGLCSPRSRAAMRAPFSAEKSRKTRSALCDALDMSDPVFMRGILDEILAMPDLAGLGKRKQSEKIEQPVIMPRSPSIRSRPARPIDDSPGFQSQDRSASSSHSSDKQRTRQRPSTPPYLQNSVYDTSSSNYNVGFDHHARASSIQSPSTPHRSYSPQARQYSPNSPRASSKYDKTPPSYDALDRDNSKASSRRSELSSVQQRSFHDSGFSEFEAWPGPRAVSTSSPAWSTRLDDAYSSPRSIVRLSEVDDDWVVDTAVGEQRTYAVDSRFDSDELGAAGPSSGIPVVIDFGQQRSRRQKSGGQPSVYGSLFEQQDPWRTIGVILGLEEEGKGGDANVPPPRFDACGNVDVEVPLDVHHDQLFDEEFDDLAKGDFGEVAVKEAIWERGEDEMDMDWDCQFSTLSKIDDPAQGQRERSPFEMPLENWRFTPVVDGLHEDIRPGGEPILDFDDDIGDGMLVDVENELCPEIDGPLMLEIDEDICDGMPVGAQSKLQDASEVQQGRVLEVAALDEVDGMFVGPALFGEDVSSSEDE